MIFLMILYKNIKKKMIRKSSKNISRKKNNLLNNLIKNLRIQKIVKCNHHYKEEE